MAASGRARGHRRRLGVEALEAGGRTKTGTQANRARCGRRSRRRATVMREPILTVSSPFLFIEILGLDEALLLAVELDEDGVAPTWTTTTSSSSPTSNERREGRTTGLALEERRQRIRLSVLRHLSLA